MSGRRCPEGRGAVRAEEAAARASLRPLTPLSPDRAIGSHLLGTPGRPVTGLPARGTGPGEGVAIDIGGIELAAAMVSRLGPSLQERRRRVPSLVTDPSVRRRLRRDGYCVTDHVIDPSCIAGLDAIASAAPGLDDLDAPGIVHVLPWEGADGPEPSVYQQAWALLVPELLRLVDQEHARVLLSAFQVKPASPTDHLAAHQDSSVVDERDAHSLSAWVSLHDSTEESGALFVLPGSHRFGSRARIGTATDDLAPLHDTIERHARVIPAAPGQVVLLDHALVHGSLPNRSGRRRIAVTSHIVSRHRPLLVPFSSDGVGPGFAALRRITVAELDEAEVALGAGRTPGPPGQVVEPLELDHLTFGPRTLDLACRMHALRRHPPQGTPFRDR
jgi:hypothetical protein